MPDRPRVLVFAGSAREGSFNRRLARAAAHAVDAAGGSATLVELRDFALPLYDADLEARDGLPEGAKRLKQLFREHRGLLLACPEYNSSVTPLLKNALDWVSRAEPGEAPLACFDGKVAALCSASPGALGGMRGLVVVRMLLGNIRVHVIPETVSVSKAGDAFADDGSLRDEKIAASVSNLAAALVRTVAALGRAD